MFYNLVFKLHLFQFSFLHPGLVSWVLVNEYTLSFMSLLRTILNSNARITQYCLSIFDIFDKTKIVSTDCSNIMDYSNVFCGNFVTFSLTKFIFRERSDVKNAKMWRKKCFSWILFRVGVQEKLKSPKNKFLFVKVCWWMLDLVLFMIEGHVERKHMQLIQLTFL